MWGLSTTLLPFHLFQSKYLKIHYVTVPFCWKLYFLTTSASHLFGFGPAGNEVIVLYTVLRYKLQGQNCTDILHVTLWPFCYCFHPSIVKGGGLVFPFLNCMVYSFWLFSLMAHWTERGNPVFAFFKASGQKTILLYPGWLLSVSSSFQKTSSFFLNLQVGRK